MNRQINRSYFFTDRDVNEALIHWIKTRDLPQPEYIGNAGKTKWTKESGGVRVEWSEEDEVEV